MGDGGVGVCGFVVEWGVDGLCWVRVIVMMVVVCFCGACWSVRLVVVSLAVVVVVVVADVVVVVVVVVAVGVVVADAVVGVVVAAVVVVVCVRRGSFWPFAPLCI